MDFDPYEVLGVEKDADQAAIHAAYRSGARAAHPDSGGSRGAWDTLSRAYGILSDKRRRAHYDNTGDAGDQFRDDKFVGALHILEHVFSTLINQALVNGTDVESIDFIKGMRQMIDLGMADHKKQLAEAKKLIAQINKARKRVKFKGKGRNFLEAVLSERARAIGHQIAEAEKQHEIGKVALKVLEDYRYEFNDPMSAAAAIARIAQATGQASTAQTGQQQYFGFDSMGRPFGSR